MQTWPLCFRDKSIIVWNLTHEEGTYGQAKRALKGHSHFVQDVVISSDGQFALSGEADQSVGSGGANLTRTSRHMGQHMISLFCLAAQVHGTVPCVCGT